MTREIEESLEKAHIELEDAEKIALIGLGRPAARSAYYAAFNAAEAIILARTGKIAKTHSGVRSEFARLMKDSGAELRSLASFLNDAYRFKEIGDYGHGTEAVITIEEARKLMIGATEFVRLVEKELRR